MSEKIFNSKIYGKVEDEIEKYLNAIDILELGIGSSVRTAGDKFPKLIFRKFIDIIGENGTKFEYASTRKPICNFSFESDSNKYFIDVITHREDTKLSMPNITSVDRFIKLYQNDNHFFCILLINYNISKKDSPITSIDFFPIEWLNFESITFGALGSGQIQIKKASELLFNELGSRKEWMIEFFDKLNTWYLAHIEKSISRMHKIKTIKEYWKNK